MIHDLSFEQRLARIDLSKVMEHVREDTGMSDEQLTRAEDLYRKFLTLKFNHPEAVIVPPMAADHVWHAHITFTRQYMSDCDMLFGAYLHHTPLDEDTAEIYNLGTVKLFESDFGINLFNYALPKEYLRAGGCR